jgi:hypothetical protein
MPDCHANQTGRDTRTGHEALTAGLHFEGRPSAGPPRVLVRLAHPAASSTRAYLARFDLSIATTAIPMSAARALDLGTIRDELGLLHTQVTVIFERDGELVVIEGSALVVPDTSPVREVVIGRDLIGRGVLTFDGPADRWSWTLVA